MIWYEDQKVLRLTCICGVLHRNCLPLVPNVQLRVIDVILLTFSGGKLAPKSVYFVIEKEILSLREMTPWSLVCIPPLLTHSVIQCIDKVTNICSLNHKTAIMHELSNSKL